jgi:hypothetical protein
VLHHLKEPAGFDAVLATCGPVAASTAGSTHEGNGVIRRIVDPIRRLLSIAMVADQVRHRHAPRRAYYPTRLSMRCADPRAAAPLYDYSL